VRESILKICGDNIKQWPILLHHVMWADRTTTRKATGHSPYYMVHGIEPLMPFDIAEATYLVPDITQPLSQKTLIELRTQQLLHRQADLDQAQEQVAERRRQAAAQYEKRLHAVIQDFDFPPRSLVLVRNVTIDSDISRKYAKRYNGPYIVVKRWPHGSYTLAELDGTISRLRFSANRLVPYHTRSPVPI
ncbi:hypothetical protein SISSUDRAFT_961052, partial [Sistotremastrum suecicum HHB10207 ss-3]